MSTQLKISCIVPASGASRRMGKDKLHLSFRNKTVLQSTLSALAPVPFFEKILVSRKTDGNHPQFRWIDGEKSETLHETLKRGLSALNPCDAVMIALADQPWLETEDYLSLFHAFQSAVGEGFSLLRPWNGNHQGNPSIIHSMHFPEIYKEPDKDKGFAYLFHRYPDQVKDISVHDGFFRDLDTPEDYQCWSS